MGTLLHFRLLSAPSPLFRPPGAAALEPGHAGDGRLVNGANEVSQGVALYRRRGHRVRIGSASGAVLAGGLSRRMGRDKASIAFAGETLLGRAVRLLSGLFDEVLVVGRDGTGDAKLRFVADVAPGRGPLGGIVTALAASASPWTFVCACDMPFLDESLVLRLWELASSAPGAPAVCPRLNGADEPLAAFYSRSALPSAQDALNRGRLSAREWLLGLGALRLELEPGSREARALVNVNTEAELAAALARAAGSSSARGASG